MHACLLVVLCVAVTSGDSAHRPRTQQLLGAVATTENGVVRGRVETSINGSPYKSFVGIPYATAPIGHLRFKAPLPAANWSGTRDALTFGPSCVQSAGGSEDCLYINVYAPLTNDRALLPVMVHFYGGGFQSGTSTDRAPDYFVENGVLLVTFNYRLGPFGFLSLQNDVIPGNAGLKDQVLALHWVQRNMAAFGGDPTRVTIFGESAGGASTSLMFLSSAAKGLFHGVVSQSGVASASWALQPNPRAVAYQLGAALGFNRQEDNTTVDDARLADFLRAANTADILAADMMVSETGLSSHRPVVEPTSDSAVITELPAVALKERRYNKVPVIVGATSAEAVGVAIELLRDEEAAAEAKRTFLVMLAQFIPLPTEEKRIEAAKLAEKFYFGAGGFNATNPQAVSDVYTDIAFIQPAHAFARTVSKTSRWPVYLYYFDYDGFGATEYGMMHAMETAYLFPGVNGPNRDPASNDWKVAQQLIELWTNFAKYGVPTPRGSSITWKRFRPDTGSYLDMKLQFVTRQHLLKQRMAFWRDQLHL